MRPPAAPNVGIAARFEAVCRPVAPTPSFSGRCSVVPGNRPICRHFADGAASSTWSGPPREVLCAACLDNRTSRFAGTSWRIEPSDGLEPSTPSLPLRFRGGTGGHRRALAITFLLQIVPSRRVSRARACPLVRGLMYPSRTRGVLSVLETDDAAGCRARRRVSFGLRIAYVPPAEPRNAGLCGCRSRAGHKSRGTVIGA
jgi:hypothetical protein